VLSACRYVSDLAVGSIALQDRAGPHATHMTFSANQQLSGWSPPPAAGEEEAKSTSAAAGPTPRIFVVFEDGSGYEVLGTDLFTAYAQRKVSSETNHARLHVYWLASHSATSSALMCGIFASKQEIECFACLGCIKLSLCCGSHFEAMLAET